MKALPSAQQPKPAESKVDILQMLKKASNTSPVNVGNDLFRVLNGSSQQSQQTLPNQHQQPPQQPPQQQPLQQQPLQQQLLQQQPLQQQQPQQQQQQQQPHPYPQQQQQYPASRPNMNFTIPISECSDRAENRLQELFDTNGNNIHKKNNMMHENAPRRAIANGELTKPFYPPFMNMSPANSPRNPGSLLQALHGGIPPPPPPSQSVPMGMPLMPQQVMGLMRPEVARRFGGRPTLSKPEFIQQLLNMIQVNVNYVINYSNILTFFSNSATLLFSISFMKIIKVKWVLLHLLHKCNKVTNSNLKRIKFYWLMSISVTVISSFLLKALNNKRFLSFFFFYSL